MLIALAPPDDTFDHPWYANNVKHLSFLGDDYTDRSNLLELVPMVLVELLSPYMMEVAGSNLIGLLFWLFHRYSLDFAYKPSLPHRRSSHLGHDEKLVER